jgi:hypothetical protein
MEQVLAIGVSVPQARSWGTPWLPSGGVACASFSRLTTFAAGIVSVFATRRASSALLSQKLVHAPGSDSVGAHHEGL